MFHVIYVLLSSEFVDLFKFGLHPIIPFRMHGEKAENRRKQKIAETTRRLQLENIPISM
jgi:hypothetical protein